MTEAGKGARRYIKFLNKAVTDVQDMFAVELDKDLKVKLRFGINAAIGEVLDEHERNQDKKEAKIVRRNGNGLSQCKRCTEQGKWSMCWDNMLYSVNGDGPYCYECAELIVKGQK